MERANELKLMNDWRDDGTRKIRWEKRILPKGGVAIGAIPGEDGLCAYWAFIDSNNAGDWEIAVCRAVDNALLLECECHRGKTFAEVLARNILRGVFSHLGRHRRRTANRRAQKEQA